MALSLDLSGRTAIVTGATSGVGHSSALALARAGAAVVAVGRDQERLGDVVAAIEGEGGQAIGVRANLVDDDAPERIVATALDRGAGELRGDLRLRRGRTARCRHA